MAYKSALRQLSTPSLYGEILKLENSIKHLRRSNEELRLHGTNAEEDRSWIQPVIAENEDVIKKQGEQMELVRTEIFERGARSGHTDKGMMAQGSNGSTMNGNAEARSEENAVQATDEGEGMQEDEPSNGVHL